MFLVTLNINIIHSTNMSIKLIFGTREIWWAPSYKPCEEYKAIDLLQYAYEKWISTFDTAPIYGKWQSEILLWKALKNKREKIEIITKFWIRSKGDIEYFSFKKKSINEELQQSLERLQTSYIDSYLLHIPNETLNVDEVIETLDELVSKKMIRSYGVSNCNWKLLQRFIQKWNIEYIQDFYNLMNLETEKLIFPYLETNHKFLAYSPLSRWLLTQQWFKTLFEKNENAINRIIKTPDIKSKLHRIDILKKIATSKWITLTEFAYKRLFENPKVDSVLIWTTSKTHLDFALECYKKYS